MSPNLHKLTKEELKWYKCNENVEEIRIKAPKGSLVLWDSRLIHQNSPPQKGRENARWRYVIYTCMLPADGIKLRDKKKIKSFVRTSNDNSLAISSLSFS